MGLRRQTAKSRTRPNRRGPKLAQLPSHVDGEVVFAYSYTDSVVADVLGALGAITGTTTKTCSIGLGSSPDTESLTIGVNHGGLEYTYTGCVPTRFSLEFDAESDAQATLGVSGQAVAKEATPTTLTLPAASTMLMASDYGTLTLNSDTFDFRTVSVNVDYPTAVKGVSYANAATVRRVVVTGMGVVCPLGNSVDALWDALQTGRSGVGPLTIVPPDSFPVSFAAQAREFAGKIGDFGPLAPDRKKAIRKGLKERRSCLKRASQPWPTWWRRWPPIVRIAPLSESAKPWKRSLKTVESSTILRSSMPVCGCPAK